MDKQIVCKDCETVFVLTVAEQEFYAEKNFDEPKRCYLCRKARKNASK